MTIVFKCKMCGGSLSFEKGASTAVCDYCGTEQTLPVLRDEKISNLYDRANHFRRASEFDKASGIYEMILNENPQDAEAYWSLVLCRYGITYVEDAATHKRIPTVNRAQYTSIFDDENYLDAIRYADAKQKELYEAEARTIDSIQRKILDISRKEKPFDIFICYKEADSSGERTQDSVDAAELYKMLTREGYKVFFSRITLEDKLGSEYEPYIFAALNSAKVMIVYGSKSEYFAAPWVRNEWSRFLSLIRNGAAKTLIPVYRNMDPYDLPDEFSHLQALDYSKIGASQDLVRGIGKIIGSSKSERPQEQRETRATQGSPSVESLMDRAYLCISDREFNKAAELVDMVLNINPRYAKAYVAQILIRLKLEKEEQIANVSSAVLNQKPEFKKALSFASPEYKATLEKYYSRSCFIENKGKAFVLLDDTNTYCKDVKASILDSFEKKTEIENVPYGGISKRYDEAVEEFRKEPVSAENYEAEMIEGCIIWKEKNLVDLALTVLQGVCENPDYYYLIKDAVSTLEPYMNDPKYKSEIAQCINEKVYPAVYEAAGKTAEAPDQDSFKKAIAQYTSIIGYSDAEGKIGETKRAYVDRVIEEYRKSKISLHSDDASRYLREIEERWVFADVTDADIRSARERLKEIIYSRANIYYQKVISSIELPDYEALTSIYLSLNGYSDSDSKVESLATAFQKNLPEFCHNNKERGTDELVKNYIILIKKSNLDQKKKKDFCDKFNCIKEYTYSKDALSRYNPVNLAIRTVLVPILLILIPYVVVLFSKCMIYLGNILCEATGSDFIGGVLSLIFMALAFPGALVVGFFYVKFVYLHCHSVELSLHDYPRRKRRFKVAEKSYNYYMSGNS